MESVCALGFDREVLVYSGEQTRCDFELLERGCCSLTLEILVEKVVGHRSTLVPVELQLQVELVGPVMAGIRCLPLLL